jgi:hypothetical protein
VEEGEARTVGVVEQVVEPVLGAAHVLIRIGESGDAGEAEQQIALAGAEVHAPEARIPGFEDVCIRVGQAGVAIPWAGIVQAAEIGVNGGAAVRRESIDGVGERALAAGLQVEDDGFEAAFAVVAGVPDHLFAGTGSSATPSSNCAPTLPES